MTRRHSDIIILIFTILPSFAFSFFPPTSSITTPSTPSTPTTIPRKSFLKMSSTESKTENGVGFIGLGIMGEGMAARLLTQSITGTPTSPLYIWNRTTSKCNDFKTKYAEYNVIIKDTAKEVVECASITYSILSTPEASKAVFDAENGVLAGVSEGKSVVDCATLAEADMARMNEAIVKKGGRFLEAPVSGKF
jgi:6-phosphogluconate dehydrogenase